MTGKQPEQKATTEAALFGAYRGMFGISLAMFVLALVAGLYFSVSTNRSLPGLSIREQADIGRLVQMPNHEEAIEQMRLVLRIHGSGTIANEAELRGKLGEFLLDRGDLKEAIENLRRTIEVNPAATGVHNNLGVAYLKMRAPDKAAIAFEQELRVNPFSAPASNNLGSLLVTQGRLDDAVTCFKHAADSDPRMIGPQLSLAKVFWQQEKFDVAADHLKQALRIDPQNTQAHNNLGNIYWRQGNLALALESMNHALETNPRYATAHNNIGLILQQQEHLAQAISHFQQALKIDPTFAEAYHNLTNATQALQGR